MPSKFNWDYRFKDANYLVMKRCFDLVLASLALLLLCVPLLFLTWQIRRKLGSPVFFASPAQACTASPSIWSSFAP